MDIYPNFEILCIYVFFIDSWTPQDKGFCLIFTLTLHRDGEEQPT
jgi:hypothetical protein